MSTGDYHLKELPEDMLPYGLRATVPPLKSDEHHFYMNDPEGDVTLTFHHDGKVSTFDKRALIELIWGKESA